MASFEYDVVISGSGSAEASPRSVPWRRGAGSVSWSRAGGGRTRPSQEPVASAGLPWFPAAELYRIPCAVETPWQRRFVSRFQ